MTEAYGVAMSVEIRPAAVGGLFYPGSPVELAAEVRTLLAVGSGTSRDARPAEGVDRPACRLPLLRAGGGDRLFAAAAAAGRGPACGVAGPRAPRCRSRTRPALGAGVCNTARHGAGRPRGREPAARAAPGEREPRRARGGALAGGAAALPPAGARRVHAGAAGRRRCLAGRGRRSDRACSGAVRKP